MDDFLIVKVLHALHYLSGKLLDSELRQEVELATLEVHLEVTARAILCYHEKAVCSLKPLNAFDNLRGRALQNGGSLESGLDKSRLVVVLLVHSLDDHFGSCDQMSSS